MGRRITSQARGRGTRRYISLRHRYKGEARNKSNIQNESHFGTVITLEHSPAHSAPIALVRYDDGEEGYIIAPEGIAIGDTISIGKGAEIKTGCTLSLLDIPDGSSIYNIEQIKGDGGRFVRASGTFAKILSKTKNGVTILMPSKKEKIFNSNCMATIGIVAGGGRTDKPFVKAGNRWHAMRARGKLYPITSAVAKNAVDHPFGSGRGRHMGKPSVPPRFAPPGRKVGQIHAKRTGRKR
ncbi:MAG TPA: 50S ribosomal protein L2 [Nanoarchaeota archaeon]|nr:large subunit ribosomal protein L2 [uncultured archaeon]KHO54235.1 MAG: large subunit ribosomal protein L2 [archaeon GW2011_AR18]HIH25979.1 50S ribosomal protein L2 [Nanoarchaeota archaeon]